MLKRFYCLKIFTVIRSQDIRSFGKIYIIAKIEHYATSEKKKSALYWPMLRSVFVLQPSFTKAYFSYM